MTVQLITGVSTGLGRAFATAALEAGSTVVGTVRRETDRAAFKALAPGRAHAVLLDVTDEFAIVPTVEGIERDIGPIDVLINNAGYGHNGLVEETSMTEVRQQMEVNFFGAVAMIKAVLPGMRHRRRGYIFNITSIGGITTFPGLGIYHASKFALEGLSETLGKEVRDLGIFVTAVEPGSFRTDWAGRSMTRVTRSIPEYDAVMNPMADAIRERSGRQPGDPRKAAAAIQQVLLAPEPPAHLLLGSDAMSYADAKLAAYRRDFDAWKHVTLSTDFPV